jgi:thiamine biosynthesis protein ThiI
VENIIKATGVKQVKTLGGRILIKLTDKDDVVGLVERIRKIFGIANLASATLIERTTEITDLNELIWSQLEGNNFASFKIDSNRVDKGFPLQSQAINEKIGAFVKERSGAQVNLTNPQLTIFIDVLREGFLIYYEKIKGLVGLPVGVSGKLVVLLSGGFDSPVAAWQMMRRGANIVFVHFHSWPQTSLESQETVKEIVRTLNTYQFKSKLYLVPFLELQQEIVRAVPAALRLVIYRRFMFKLAEFIAAKEEAGALVTGESMGQVASQTLENMGVISEAVEKLSIFRPLIGTDKEEIINLNRQIDIYDLSVQPFDDCCSLFVPEHPETKAKLNEVLIYEEAVKGKRLMDKVLEKAQVIEIS